jgi:hypothetical protein
MGFSADHIVDLAWPDVETIDYPWKHAHRPARREGAQYVLLQGTIFIIEVTMPFFFMFVGEGNFPGGLINLIRY